MASTFYPSDLSSFVRDEPYSLYLALVVSLSYQGTCVYDCGVRVSKVRFPIVYYWEGPQSTQIPFRAGPSSRGPHLSDDLQTEMFQTTRLGTEH